MTTTDLELLSVQDLINEILRRTSWCGIIVDMGELKGQLNVSKEQDFRGVYWRGMTHEQAATNLHKAIPLLVQGTDNWKPDEGADAPPT